MTINYGSALGLGRFRGENLVDIPKAVLVRFEDELAFEFEMEVAASKPDTAIVYVLGAELGAIRGALISKLMAESKVTAEKLSKLGL